MQSGDDQARGRREMNDLANAARRWQEELRAVFEKSIAAKLTDDN
jgi:hypothetical protein